VSAYIVLGAGTFAADLTDMLDECGHKVVGYVVNVGTWVPGMRFLDRPVYDARVYPTNWPDEGFVNFPFLPGIISPRRSTLVMQMVNHLFKAGDPFVHKSASVSPSAKLGGGVVIGRGAVVACGTSIRSCTIVNRSASIGHHNDIAIGVTIGPGAILCGNVSVGVDAVVGAGAIVLEDRTIGQNAKVGAGAVVTHDVPPDTTVIGVPAHPHWTDSEMPAKDW